jgi:hypothetical protein
MNATFRALKMTVYGTLGPDEMDAKPSRHIVRQAKIYSVVFALFHRRNASA